MPIEALIASLRPGGGDFERLCKWLLDNAPEYRSRLKHVWLWQDWPGRWGADAGIDLVAEDREGGLWAVQAKHYDPAYAIKKADIDSFLSESSRPGFSYRLLIASTDHVGPTARRTLDAQERPVGTLLRSDLGGLDIDWPRSIKSLRPPRAKPKRPRPHQRRALRDLLHGLGDNDRGQLVMACGTGKTLVARFLHDELQARRTLLLVPSLSLVKQTLREWFAVGDIEYLAVCSDETVAPGEDDAVVSSTSELGVPVTTDAGAIAAFLRKRGRRVVFATYQSSPRIAEAQNGRTPAFDLVIADEAHRCAGPVAGVFATVLDARKINARKRVFMTATPHYFTGRVLREAAEADWEIASMNDRERFGPVLHELSFARAIEQDLLSDYQVVVVGVSDETYRKAAERGAFVTTDGETITDARTLGRQLGLLRTMAKHDLQRVVTFHSRIAAARRFASSTIGVAAWMPADRRPSGTLWAEHVSGNMTSGERETKLNRLRQVEGAERGILANARCLSEGVDVPTLDGVAFIDPRRSQVDVVQAVGRAIRKAEDKNLGTVVIPVFVDEDADPEAALESSEFDRVWQIVRALRDHDDVLADELDEWRRELGRRGTLGDRPGKIRLDLPSAVDIDFGRAFDARLVESASQSWEFWFGVLERFVNREGHARVPTEHVEAGVQLGDWVARQRRLDKRGKLDGERVARLESLPGWTWDALVDAWDEAYAALQAFVDREGHARIPAADYVEAGVLLGGWVSRQRERYQHGQLDAQRGARLERVPGWSWSPYEAAWEEAFEALVAFVDREGHTRVPSGHVEVGFRLGLWVVNQRKGRMRGELGGERAARLASLPGWTWDTRAAAWEEAYAAMQAFVDREGHARVPPRQVEAGVRLGDWVANQRAQRNRGALDAKRTARLESQPGWTWDAHARAAAWEEAYAALQAFVEREGHARPPRDYVDAGVSVGAWVQHQRAQRNRGALDAKRTARLESQPGWTWDPHAAAWEEAFAALQAFVDREGHARVPGEHEEAGVALGWWAKNQRAQHKRGQLDAERVARLEAVSGWIWDPYAAAWEEAFAALQAFVDREGHARVPQGQVEAGVLLGGWVSRQRGGYRRRQLDAERTARLEGLPGWSWSPYDADWEEAFAALQAFVDREGHARVPSGHVEAGVLLGGWVSRQRGGYRRRQLDAEPTARLESLRGWTWDPFGAAWEEAYELLMAFDEREGHARVRQDHVEAGFALGRWVSNQRTRHRSGRLKSDQIARLEALPGWTWDARGKH